ncbi:MAG TPA: 3-methyl-2-oxobutanoate hydroxymethyltransferase [Bacillota bacterium]|jgi:3-methyl-2-oxobutanoate hydroxymethyltransferase|nr:3-methyl-2-oxobutanoate hydroxymethyltransferase [Bacillota bacterium]
MGKKITVQSLLDKKTKNEKIVMLTAYDCPMGVMMDRAGIDVVLVGDSLGMVVLGHENTLPVTMDDIIHHASAVVRGCRKPMVIGDMPFMSYQVSVEDAVRNAGRLMKEAGVDAVKLEGGSEVVGAVRRMVDAGIPVMGHLGLTPQSVNMLGGYKVQGKTVDSAQKIIDDALALQDAGVFALLLECIPAELGKIATSKVDVPVIGIGAGPDCDGQCLVTPDMLGLFDRFVPTFVKQYLDLSEQIGSALAQYAADVRGGAFPEPKHCFASKSEDLKVLY